MDPIQKLDVLYSNDIDILNKINELVDRVNQSAKPLLICRVPLKVIAFNSIDKHERTIESIRSQIGNVIGDNYLLLCVADDSVSTFMFEIHNQQSEVRKEFIVQLENLKVEQDG